MERENGWKAAQLQRLQATFGDADEFERWLSELAKRLSEKVQIFLSGEEFTPRMGIVPDQYREETRKFRDGTCQKGNYGLRHTREHGWILSAPWGDISLGWLSSDRGFEEIRKEYQDDLSLALFYLTEVEELQSQGARIAKQLSDLGLPSTFSSKWFPKKK